LRALSGPASRRLPKIGAAVPAAWPRAKAWHKRDMGEEGTRLQRRRADPR